MAFTSTVKEIIERNSNQLLGKHESWERFRLGDIAEIQNGAPYDSGRFNTVGEGMPLLRIRDVTSDRTQAYYSGPYEPHEIVHRDDLIIGMDGDFKSALWAGPPALLNQRVCRINLKSDRVDRRFVFLVLQGYLDAINEATPSITVKHLSSKTVAELLLPLPPRAEQERIVERANALMADCAAGSDDAEAAATLLHALHAAVLGSAVTGTLVPGSGADAGELLDKLLAVRRDRWEAQELARLTAKGTSPKGDSWKNRYKAPAKPNADEHAFDLPQGWVWATVDQVSEVVQYGTSAKTRAETEDDDVPVLRMGNIDRGEIVRLQDLKYLPAGHSDFPELLLENGDVLFNRTNSAELVGKAAVYRGEPAPASFASYLIRLRLLDGVLPEYLVMFLTSHWGRRWVSTVVTQQVGQANVNGTKLKSLTFPLPPLDDQLRIVGAATSWLGEAAELSQATVWMAARGRDFTRALLRDAVEGRLTEQLPDDGSAVELLEEIRTEALERREARKPERAKKRHEARAGAYS